jgi:lipid-A-disaccharide synthase
VELLHHSDQLAFMGFAEVLRHLPYLLRVMGHVREFLARTEPGLVVLVDYPAFNLRVAKEAKARGCKVLYYISPQVWAWHEERVTTLAERTDAIACVLPFEESWYERKQQEYGVTLNARFVGHPLIDAAAARTESRETRADLLLPPQAPIVALLPGSRRQEVSKLLPPMADAVRHLRGHLADLIPIICAAPGVETDFYERLLSRTGLSPAPAIPEGDLYGAGEGVHIIRARTYDVLSAARGALVTSGTATLETGLLGTPLVIAYRLNPISWHITRRRVKVPSIGLVNLVAGERLVPELLQREVTGSNLAARLVPLLEDGAERKRVLEGLKKVREKLGEGGAAERVAALAESLLTDPGGPRGPQ